MGNKSSTRLKPLPDSGEASKKAIKCKPIDVYVAHYTPSSFPLIPIVTATTMRLCRESWARILAPVEKDGVSVSGVTIFYTEFYDTLSVFDKMGKFDAVFRKHSAGMNGLSARGAILVRIINYSLALDPDSPHVYQQLRMLGIAHNQRLIRPWQYGVFVQIMMNTISSRLDSLASYEIMTAWSHLFSFILQQMLPEAIKNLVDTSEVDINRVDEVERDKLAKANDANGWMP